MQTTNEHQITFTCKDCGTRETFFATMRSLLVMRLDRSMWHSEVDQIGAMTCGDCHGSPIGFAAYNAVQYERQRYEESVARKAKKDRAA